MHPRKVLEWDDYFMEMCEFISMRSKDPSTQHGAVLVDENHRFISAGYNGGSRKINDELIDWDRPNKYHYVLHAEENAILTAEKKYLDNCTIYVTGPPCSRCMLRISHAGVSRILYGSRSSQCVDDSDWKISENIARLSSIKLESYKGGDFSHLCSQQNGRT